MDSTEAAQALGISLDALRKRIARGTIEATKEGGHWYVQGPELAIAAMEARIKSLENQLATK